MRDHPMAELPERSLLVNVDSGLRQEHVSIHRAIGDVEGVQPVRPVPHTRRAAETVVELPADPLAGGKTHGWGPSRPRWDGKQGLHSGKDAQPSVGFAKLDVNLAQVFLDAMGLEAVSFMHADHVRKRGRHRRDSEADRGRVPTGGGLSSAGLFRPGRPYPLDGDSHGLHPCHSIEDLTLCARLLRHAPTPPTARAATRRKINLNCPHKVRNRLRGHAAFERGPAAADQADQPGAAVPAERRSRGRLPEPSGGLHRLAVRAASTTTRSRETLRRQAAGGLLDSAPMS